MSARLEFKGVSRTFQTPLATIQALQDVHLSVMPNSFVALVGPSGCGKSTMLNIAARLDTQHTGEFFSVPPEQESAYLFQAPRLLPWLSARENVAFVLRSKGMSRGDAGRRADELLELVGLTGAGHQFPETLSGGMKQRVALARALSVNPSVMFMDEPFSALDELTARRLRAELLELHMQHPRTVLFVTHHIAEAVFLADVVVVMASKPGRIIDSIAVDIERPRDYDDEELAKVARVVTQMIFREGGANMKGEIQKDTEVASHA